MMISLMIKENDMRPEQQWQFDELFSDYEAEIKARENAEKEVIEQCRLNAMGSEREAKLMAELAAYRSWAEVEIADLRDDVKRHIEIASFNAEDSLQWRTMFQNERNHINAAQKEIERLKESLRLLQAQYCRTIDPLLEDDGETPRYKAENERLRGELAELQNAFEDAVTPLIYRMDEAIEGEKK